MKRFAALIAAALPVVAICTVAMGAAPASAATNVVACAGHDVWMLPIGTSDHSWAGTSSPYTLYFKDDGSSKTEFLCDKVPNTDDDFEFEQVGTERCLYINIGASRVINEGACDSNNAQWHLSSVGSDWELESLDNLACIYDAGSGAAATYNPCKEATGENGDVFDLETT